MGYLDLAHQAGMLRAPGRDGRLVRQRVADDARAEARLRLDLPALLVPAPRDVVDGERLCDGEPDDGLGEGLARAQTPAEPKSVAQGVGRRAGAEKPRRIKDVGVGIDGWVVCEPPVFWMGQYR